MASPLSHSNVLNINVGVLGHVDSGKTSLARALSTTGSTAAFDKHPQSQARGITLDLGFSSFVVPLPQTLEECGSESLQFTLVDCPGHASLIRTIIGGAQIIDLMMLVIDITKGVQTQTAECLVIGELTCSRLVVVLNKVDMLEPASREAKVEKMKARLLKTFAATRFKDPPMIAVAARPGGGEGDAKAAPENLEALVELLRQQVTMPDRNAQGPFSFAIDHCFAVKGQGTVITGTALSGSVKVGEEIEFPLLKTTRKIKSIQMFRRPVEALSQGDRAGICCVQFDASTMERGVACTPGSMTILSAAVARVRRIRFYKGECTSRAQFHVSVGHMTVMATVTFFTDPLEAEGHKEYGPVPASSLDMAKTYAYADSLEQDSAKAQYAVLVFQKPVTCASDALVIASRLDADAAAPSCRLAFHGRLAAIVTDKEPVDSWLRKVHVCKDKERRGAVERMQDEQTLVCRGLFQKESRIDKFLNLKVFLSTGEEGVIESPFGQSGKFKVRLRTDLQPDTIARLPKGKRGKKEGPESDEGSSDVAPVEVILRWKKYVFDPARQLAQ